MLDLSYLGGRNSPAAQSGADAAGTGLDQAYARYAAEARAQNPQGVLMTPENFERFSLGSGWLEGFKDVAKKVVQTCRLMIGIHDYEYYLDHMRSRHPEATPLTREAFYRYCLEARYPSADRPAGSSCPC